MSDDLHRAISEFFTEYARDWRAALANGAKLAAKKPFKEALKPLAYSFKHGVDRVEIMVQKSLELPTDHPLHAAVAALVAAGRFSFTPWTPLPLPPQPKRAVHALYVSPREPLVYALELGPRVSVWSLESGAYLADLPIAGKAETAVATLVELEDGTLRALVNDGRVAERAPGAKAFVAVHECGELHRGWAATDDLALALSLPSYDSVATPQGDIVCVSLHDIAARTTRSIELPFTHITRSFVRIGDEVVVAGRRVAADGSEAHALALVQLRTGVVEHVSLGKRELHSAQRGLGASIVSLHLTWEGEPAPGYANVDFDVPTRTETVGVPLEPDPDRFALRTPDGRRYDFARGVLTDAAGVELTAFKLTESPHNRAAAWDAARGQVVLAGNDPSVQVQVFAPYDAARAAAAPKPVVTTPLVWAARGVVLTYEIADFDAHDTWRFEVLDADRGLALKIVMDADEVVAEAARFSEGAIEKAQSFVQLAQGGSDVDLAVEQAARVPPIVLARASAKKLAAGKSLAFSSEWSKKVKLEPQGASVAYVRVDGEERAVDALRAGDAAGVALTVLADPRWPLVIERVEGDCFVRLIAVDLRGAA